MPSIFISEDDLISIFEFIKCEQFYSISQVNVLFAKHSVKPLKRYPERQEIELVRIKNADGNGQQNGNRLFLCRPQQNRGGLISLWEKQPMEEREIPFVSNLNECPKIPTIHLIQIMAPLQEYALQFLQGCNLKFNDQKEVHFTLFDDLAQSHTPDQLAMFSTALHGFHCVHLITLPTQLDAFAQFLNITECRNIQIHSLRECDVNRFVEWLTQNPLKQVYEYPIFNFSQFFYNVPELLITKCRQAFINTCTGENVPTTMLTTTEMCPYYHLSLLNKYPSSPAEFTLEPVEQFPMQNPNNGDEFFSESRGNMMHRIEFKPQGQIGLRAEGMRDELLKTTRIWVDFYKNEPITIDDDDR